MTAPNTNIIMQKMGRAMKHKPTITFNFRYEDVGGETLRLEALYVDGWTQQMLAEKGVIGGNYIHVTRQKQ